MATTVTEGGFAVSEAAVIARIVAIAPLVGWTPYTVGVTPTGVTWFTSTGISGAHNIVVGIAPDTVARFVPYSAADFDLFSIVAALKGGYINNDSAGNTTTKVVQKGLSAAWPITRKLASSYAYLIVADADCITVEVRTIEAVSGTKALFGIITLGIPRAEGRPLQAYACARITGVDASTPSATVITLDDDITYALTDGYVDTPYSQGLMFQSVATMGMPIGDFALTQRIPIVAGSLSAPGNPTSFAIDATLTGKLTGTGKRYRAGRGTGDVVRLCSQPTFGYAYASASGGVGASANAYCSHDGMGGQSAAVYLKFDNYAAAQIASADPAPERNKPITFPLYAIMQTISTTLVTQADSQGRGTVGVHRHLIRSSRKSGVAQFGLSQLNYGASRYRSIGSPPTGEGLYATGNGGSGGISTHLIGPGW